MFLLSFSSFFKGLFKVDGAESGSVLAFLPYLITALAIGVVLASVYFTLWRFIEARLAKRLHAAGATAAADGVTLEEIGISASTLRGRILRYLLRSRACMVYKNISCDELDAQRLAMMIEMNEVSAPAPQQPSSEDDSTPAPVEETVPNEEGAPVDETTPSEEGAPVPENSVAEEEKSEPAELATPEAEAPETAPAEERAKPFRPRFRLKLAPEARFYILPTRVSYVEEHALKFSIDECWGLIYTVLGAAVIWLGALALLDSLAALLMR